MATERIETEIDLNGPTGGEVINDGAGSTPKGDELEIVVRDDTPDEDRGRKPFKGPSAVPTDEEIGEYTKGVQDRIRQMKREYHDVRRERDEFIREHSAAIDFAKRIH